MPFVELAPQYSSSHYFDLTVGCISQDNKGNCYIIVSCKEIEGTTVWLLELVSLVGFEPTTYCLEGSRSIQLSYRDVWLSVAQGKVNKQAYQDRVLWMKNNGCLQRSGRLGSGGLLFLLCLRLFVFFRSFLGAVLGGVLYIAFLGAVGYIEAGPFKDDRDRHKQAPGAIVTFRAGDFTFVVEALPKFKFVIAART